VIVKFFLNISKRVQKQRFLDRLKDPKKQWKFSLADLAERAYWSHYMAAYEDALQATSTSWARWHVVPADNKWITRAVVADILTTTIRSLDLRYPKVGPSERVALARARNKLLKE
jgi:polyphosphate kinase 2 (PPK2 family)